jgi:hypothetical protein
MFSLCTQNGVVFDLTTFRCASLFAAAEEVCC